jgi:hypothetical protein
MGLSARNPERGSVQTMASEDALPLLVVGVTGADVAGDALGAVETVGVLVESELEDRGAALARDDGRRREEERPDAEPARAVFGEDLLLVREPVLKSERNETEISLEHATGEAR